MERLDRSLTRGIQALVLIILAGGPLAFGAVDPIPFAIIAFLTCGVAALWAVRVWVNPQLRFLWPPVCWAVVAFVIYAVIRYAKADIEYVARGELLHVLVYGFLFLAIVNNAHRQEAAQFVACALIFLAMCIAGYAVFQFVANSDRVWNVFKPYAHRGTGTYINPNHLGGFLEMVLPLALAFVALSRFKAVSRILCGYAAIVILAGILVTNSRGAWLSTGIDLFLFAVVLLFNRSHRKIALAVLLLFATAAAISIPKNPFLHHRARQLIDPNGKVADDMRFALWRPAVELWREHPWIGVGPGLFDSRFRQYRPETVQLQPEHAHNDYLDALADYGMIGVSIIGAAIILTIGAAFSAWRELKPNNRDISKRSGGNKYALVCGASLGLAAILFHSIVDFNMHIPANAILTISLMALIAGYSRFASDAFWFRAQAWNRAAVSAMCVAVAIYIGMQCGKGYREAVWLGHAHRAPLYSPKEIECLKNAFAIDRMNAGTAFQIGEAYRHLSQEGGTHYQEISGQDYAKLANEAMAWFATAMKLNRFDGYADLGYGWCLDWLGRHDEAAPYFSRAESLDPNGYFAMQRIGEHFVESGKFAAARPWFERSLRLEGDEVRSSGGSLKVVNLRLMENATNDFSSLLLRAK
jgi:O-antigen ligase